MHYMQKKKMKINMMMMSQLLHRIHHVIKGIVVLVHILQKKIQMMIGQQMMIVQVKKKVPNLTIKYNVTVRRTTTLHVNKHGIVSSK